MIKLSVTDPKSGCQALKHWGAADERKVIEDTADQYFTVLEHFRASCFISFHVDKTHLDNPKLPYTSGSKLQNKETANPTLACLKLAQALWPLLTSPNESTSIMSPPNFLNP